MIYTSDHGEDIFDDRRHLFLHASPFPSYWQLHVPLVVWTSDAYRQRHADLVATLEANRHRAAESNSVFHTLLTLGGVATATATTRSRWPAGPTPTIPGSSWTTTTSREPTTPAYSPSTWRRCGRRNDRYRIFL